MQNENKQRKTIASVIKAIDVIEHLAQSAEDLGVTEISEDLGMGVSATYHLLNTLRECGIIDQDDKTKKFKLSLKLWQIGMKAYSKNNISVIIKPYLKKLKELTGETANLTVLDNDHIVYVAQEESDKAIKMFTKTGASAPLHCTGAGKILLAYQNEEKKNNILNNIELKKYTEFTITDKNELIKKLDEIKRQGYGFDEEERNLDVFCVGAPVFGINGEIIGCLSISGPKSRFTEDNLKQWTKIVMDTADEATKYLKGE
jgi:DNA-binding IclR family transcriptional regulator